MNITKHFGFRELYYRTFNIDKNRRIWMAKTPKMIEYEVASEHIKDEANKYIQGVFDDEGYYPSKGYASYAGYNWTYTAEDIYLNPGKCNCDDDDDDGYCDCDISCFNLHCFINNGFDPEEFLN